MKQKNKIYVESFELYSQEWVSEWVSEWEVHEYTRWYLEGKREKINFSIVSFEARYTQIDVALLLKLDFLMPWLYKYIFIYTFDDCDEICLHIFPCSNNCNFMITKYFSASLFKFQCHDIMFLRILNIISKEGSILEIIMRWKKPSFHIIIEPFDLPYIIEVSHANEKLSHKSGDTKKIKTCTISFVIKRHWKWKWKCIDSSTTDTSYML
jgi:hypothetical protein